MRCERDLRERTGHHPQNAYRRKTKITKRSDTCARVEKKIGGFHIAMNNFPLVDIAEGRQQTAHVGFNSGHRKGAIEFLLQDVNMLGRGNGENTHSKILVPVIGHNHDDLVETARSSDKLGYMATTQAVYQDRYLIFDAFGAAGHIYALDCNKDFGTLWSGGGLIVGRRGRRMMAMPWGVVPLCVIVQIQSFVDGRKGPCS